MSQKPKIISRAQVGFRAGVRSYTTRTQVTVRHQDGTVETMLMSEYRKRFGKAGKP